MKIEPIHGQFSQKEAIDLLTQIIHVKIKFHEGKIASHSNEEEVKMRENRIKKLQRELFETRRFIEAGGANVNIQGEITLSH